MSLDASPSSTACERLDGDKRTTKASLNPSRRSPRGPARPPDRRPLRQRCAVPKSPAPSRRHRGGKQARPSPAGDLADPRRRLCRPPRARPARAGVGDGHHDRPHLRAPAAQFRDDQLPRAMGPRRRDRHRIAQRLRRPGEPGRLRRHDRLRQPRLLHGRPGVRVPRAGVGAAAAQCAGLPAQADHRRDRAEGLAVGAEYLDLAVESALESTSLRRLLVFDYDPASTTSETASSGRRPG